MLERKLKLTSLELVQVRWAWLILKEFELLL